MGKGEKTIVIPRLNDKDAVPVDELDEHLTALEKAWRQLTAEIDTVTHERNKRIHLMSRRLIQEWATNAPNLPPWFKCGSP